MIAYKTIKCPLHFSSMANKAGLVQEHRLLMALKLDRVLLSSEIIHHIDGNMKNNNINNLQLTNRSEHKKLHLHKKRLASGGDKPYTLYPVRMEPELLLRIRIRAKSKRKMASWVRAALWEAVNK